nr:transposase [Caloranaerobacter azorensis]
MLKEIEKNKQTDNRRNGYTDKKVKTQFEEMQIEVPRDRIDQM